jgi:hypothetical protein
MEIPQIEIAPDEDLEDAYEKAIRVFEATGLSVDRVKHMNYSLSTHERQFTRIFATYTGISRNFSVLPGARARVFLVCPFSWSKELTSVIEKRCWDISYLMGHDGFATDFVFLTAYPLPRELEVLAGKRKWWEFWK